MITSAGPARQLGKINRDAAGERDAVAGAGFGRLIGREQVVVRAADELLAREAEELPGHAVDQTVAKIAAVLDKDHRWYVLDDRV